MPCFHDSLWHKVKFHWWGTCAIQRHSLSVSDGKCKWQRIYDTKKRKSKWSMVKEDHGPTSMYVTVNLFSSLTNISTLSTPWILIFVSPISGSPLCHCNVGSPIPRRGSTAFKMAVVWRTSNNSNYIASRKWKRNYTDMAKWVYLNGMMNLFQK